MQKVTLPKHLEQMHAGRQPERGENSARQALHQKKKKKQNKEYI